ncbi:UNVERIFIED_CONTAM: hypothetical protein GTU68_023379 [Idotea baltica]|nr:hypothetical protein [Idotea baltica]
MQLLEELIDLNYVLLYLRGIIPYTFLIKSIKENVKVPVYCMVRPRGGPMTYSEKEKEVLLFEAKDLKEAGADGLVFGALTEEGNVDQQLCKEFIKVAEGLPCTFHRAFDLTLDPLAELEVIIDLGFRRILTSGCKSSAVEGSVLIKKLTQLSNGRIVIMAGAGVRASNCLSLISKTGVSEIHTSAKMKKTFATRGSDEARMGETDDNVVFVASSQEVKCIRSQLDNL